MWHSACFRHTYVGCMSEKIKMTINQNSLSSSRTFHPQPKVGLRYDKNPSWYAHIPQDCIQASKQEKRGTGFFSAQECITTKKSEGICQRHSALTLVSFALNHLLSTPVFFYYITLILFSFQRLAVLLTSFLWLPLPTRLDIWISRRHVIYICDKGHQK